MTVIRKVKGVAGAANRYRVTITFYTFYIIANYILVVLNHGVYPSSNAAQFATTWFNPTENRLPIYGSIEAGLAVNFVFPLICIVIAEYYSRNLQRTVTKRFLSIDSVFVLSVLATYTYTYLYCLINHVVGMAILIFELMNMVVS